MASSDVPLWVAGEVQASTSFDDDGHVDKALRFARSSVQHFSVGPGRKNRTFEIVTMDVSFKDIRFGGSWEG
jgi:hypothetical protein